MTAPRETESAPTAKADPTEPGFYWAIYDNGYEVVQIIDSAYGLEVFRCGNDSPHELKWLMDYQRIEPPTE